MGMDARRTGLAALALTLVLALVPATAGAVSPLGTMLKRWIGTVPPGQTIVPVASLLKVIVIGPDTDLSEVIP